MSRNLLPPDEYQRLADKWWPVLIDLERQLRHTPRWRVFRRSEIHQEIRAGQQSRHLCLMLREKALDEVKRGT